jgi:lariat debranching enzyme
MPAKYRKMADYHEYYSGTRKAPFLTIFIGGNHEASNHLFELYYGGWVAPNIYYMGAANILRLGPLRIAALSGIWKGYDYRKPHFERAPYNESETVSIFHVRELDVRKMLSVRTQVDIGLSHDWPQGVEWMGDFRWLFRKKDRFEGDANDGKLGSIAARQCLDRLRPSYWFSAHLHIKYAAMVQHGDYNHTRPPQGYRPRHGVSLFERSSSQANAQEKPEPRSSTSETHANLSIQEQPSRTSESLTGTTSPLTTPSKAANGSPTVKLLPRTSQQAQVNAWQNFHVSAVKAEAQDTEALLKKQREQAAEEERTGIRRTSQYTFDETWKQVKIDDRVERGIASVSKSVRSPGDDGKVADVDGCIESKLKRRRSQSPDRARKSGLKTPPPKPSKVLSGQVDGHIPSLSLTTKETNITRNVDEIEIDLSDSSSDGVAAENVLPFSDSMNAVAAVDGCDIFTQGDRQNPNKRVKPELVVSDDSDDGGVKLDPTSPPFVPRAKDSFQAFLTKDPFTDKTTSRSDLGKVDEEKVSDSMRAQLAKLSSAFALPSNQQPISAPLPLPDSISNTTTQFLALDKCEQGRDFLQLLEVESISEPSNVASPHPYRLQYDKEWLAILRVFAPELELGGDPNGTVPPHKGDTYYCTRITEEEAWVEEHVVEPGRLTVPENFAITAPIYDPNEVVTAIDKPREYTSPQTSTFCELIGIENQFDMSEEEREMRMDRGARPEERNSYRGGRGGGRGGRESGFNGRGRGGQNGGRGGRGRGRGGRGRSRGGW